MTQLQREMAGTEGRVKSEWEAEQTKVINWVWRESRRQDADAEASGCETEWLDGILGSGGLRGEGRGQRECRTQLCPTTSDTFLNSCSVPWAAK